MRRADGPGPRLDVLVRRLEVDEDLVDLADDAPLAAVELGAELVVGHEPLPRLDHLGLRRPGLEDPGAGRVVDVAENAAKLVGADRLACTLLHKSSTRRAPC